jgi:hypothetical protein
MSRRPTGAVQALDGGTRVLDIRPRQLTVSGTARAGCEQPPTRRRVSCPVWRSAGLGGMLSLSNLLATAGDPSRSSGFTGGTGAGMDTDQTDEPAAVGWRFRTPPGWPEQPIGWRPPAGWAPDPQRPPAPSGWQFWEPDTEHRGPSAAQAQAQPVHSSAVNGAAPAQPIGNWPKHCSDR